MATIEAKAAYTAEEFLHLPESKDFELVDGVLVERNMGSVSSWVGGQVHTSINIFLRSNPQGWAWPADNGYRCFPDSPNTVRKPDVSFIRLGRLPGEVLPQGYIRIAPDLVVEVISPHDLAYEIDDKVLDYLAAGVRLVWVINPASRVVHVHRANGSVSWLVERDQLDGEDVLPGFHCALSQIFPPRASIEPVASQE